jgi:O-antigen ligase
MFRTAVNEPEYQIEFYVSSGTTPPHAHNEWLQMGADLGIPGFLMFLAMQVVILWMLWQGWRSDQPHAQIMAVAVFGGLLAHSVYGLGDAITLWDRFSFILWWLVGLAGAQYVLSRPQPDTVNNPI